MTEEMDKSRISVRTLANFLGDVALEQNIFNPAVEVYPESINSATFDSVSFLDGPRAALTSIARPGIENIGLVICKPDDRHLFDKRTNWITVDSPRLQFARVCNRFFPILDGSQRSRPFFFQGISQLRGSGQLIFGKDYLSTRTQIFPGGIVVHPNVRVGSGTMVGAGVVLGGDGFGFVDGNGGLPTRQPHYGGVIIGQNCDIGRNCCIDRGTFRETIIANGVKIANLVQIAHNVHIGPNCLVAAGAVVSGSVSIGTGSWIGPNATISDGVSIAAKTHVALGAVVVRNTKRGERVVGNPARPVPKLS